MKISNSIKEKKIIDFNSIYNELLEKYNEIYVYDIEDETFIYRPLNRKEYKDLQLAKELTNEDREEIICETCVLYPEHYNFEECLAGIPSSLTKDILKNSYLSSIDDRINVLSYYRNEMYQIDNQINCIINEAFPNLSIEEIENFTISQMGKYYSQAEWKLLNLRNANINQDIIELLLEAKENKKSNNTTNDNTINNKDNSKNKMSLEKIKELKEKFPELNISESALKGNNINDFNVAVDTISPALRTK